MNELSIGIILIGIFLATCLSIPNYVVESGEFQPLQKSTNSYQDSVNLMLEMHANSFLEAPNVSSVSIGVYKNGRKYTGHFGILSETSKESPTDQTIYEIGSNTKTFAGFLTAKAVMEGKLRLEDNVSSYLDEPYPNLSMGDSTVKIKHLLTHTSGLINILPVEVFELLGKETEPETPGKINQVLRQYNKELFLKDLHEVQLKYEPGNRFSYSNAAVELLGYILQKVNEDSFDRLLKTYIFEKAAMTSTKLELTEKDKPRIAPGKSFSNQPNPLFYNPLWGAAYKLNSTTTDMVNYLGFQLDSTNSIAKKSREILFESRRRIAYLWRADIDPEGKEFFFHHGGSFRTQNMIFIFPERELGIVVITNRSDYQTGPQLRKLAMDLSEALM